MASVTYDGRSLMLDGRRIWIVGGAIQHARFAPGEWEGRLRAARQAGLNTVETAVVWSMVEPRPGQFDFTGRNDIRRFVELAGEIGLSVILRPGPFVGEGWDLGGLPAWLCDMPDLKLRTANQPFLERVSKYLSAVAGQVRDLQVTATGDGGPIVLVQNETQWTCGDTDLGASYLGELNRYLREAGFTVPKINGNNLWQGVEGEIDCWVGERELLSTLRQLGTVRPEQPRIIVDFGHRVRPVFGEPVPELPSEPEVVRQLTEILAGCGQFVLSPFAAGTTPGFMGGRDPLGGGRSYAAPEDAAAPIDDLGGYGPRHAAVRRVSMFASNFARVLASLDPDHAPMVLDPISAVGSAGQTASGGPTVVHCSGSQGDVAFVFADPSTKAKQVSLLLPDGSSLEVPIGSSGTSWCVFGVHLTNKAELDYCSLSAFAIAGDVFVCSGPAGATGALSINGTPIDVTVPKGRTPEIVTGHAVTVVVCSEEMLAETVVLDESVVVGVRGVGDDGALLPVGKGKGAVLISAGGSVQKLPHGDLGPDPAIEIGKARPNLGTWECAPADEYVTGTSPRYAQIPGPAPLAELGSAYGYGWYRLSMKLAAGKRGRIACPEGGDRLHLFIDGESSGVLGTGPGAETELNLSFRKGQHDMVVLADNQGRPSGGVHLAEHKGMPGHLWEVVQYRMTKPALEQHPPIEVLTKMTPLPRVRDGDATHPQRITWHFQHRRKSPIFAALPPAPLRGMLILNDEPLRWLEQGEQITLVLDEATTRRGNNTLQFAVMNDFADDTAADTALEATAVTFAGTGFLEGKQELTAKAEWAFAKWEPPAPSAFGADAGPKGMPAWWRTRFDAALAGVPVTLELTGLTKGQVYLNGENLARYFVQTASGAEVPPVSRVSLPLPMLREHGNELLIFDEHGASPAKCKIKYEKQAV